MDQFDVYVADASAPVILPVRISPRSVDVNKSAAWSPDGNSVAYVSQRGPFAEKGSTRLVVQRLSDRAEREVVFDFALNATELAWSPDGHRLAIRTSLGAPTRPGLMGVSVLTLNDGLLRRTFRPGSDNLPNGAGVTASWLDAATLLIAGRGELRAIDADTGGARLGWGAPPGTTIVAALVAPDGTRVAVHLASPPNRGPASRLALLGVTATSLAVRGELAMPADARPVAWTPDGAAVLVTRRTGTGDAGARMQLWRYPLDGTPASELPLASSQIVQVSAHPDGKRIALTLGSPSIEFWMASGFAR